MELSLVGERYSCTGCGDCCRGWSVPLLPGEAERFRTIGADVIPVERLRVAIHSARGGGVAVEALSGAGARCGQRRPLRGRPRRRQGRARPRCDR